MREPAPELRRSSLLKIADRKQNYSLFFCFQKRYSNNGEADWRPPKPTFPNPPKPDSVRLISQFDSRVTHEGTAD